MSTQMMWTSNKWALEYIFFLKILKIKNEQKNIYILDSIFFTLRKKNKKNLNANSMNFLCLSYTTLTLSYINP